MTKKLLFSDFIDRVNEHYHGRLTPYEDTYRGQGYDVKVHCNIHNIDFEVNAYALSTGKSNCPLCYSDHMRDVQLQKLDIQQPKILELTDEYVLNILKNNKFPDIRKSYKNVYVYLLRRFPKPKQNSKLCSEVLIYMIENKMSTYPVDADGNYLMDAGFMNYIVKDTEEEPSKEYVLKCLKDVKFTKSLKIHYPKAYDYLFNVMYPLPDDYNIKIPSPNGYIYMIEHNFENYPKSPITGEYMKFINSKKGFYLGENNTDINQANIKTLDNEGIPRNTEELVEMLLTHILSLYDLDGNIIEYEKLEIKRERRFDYGDYRNWLYIDGENCNPKKIKVKYVCRCGEVHIIYLSKYLEKEKLICKKCNQSLKYGCTSFNSKHRITKRKPSKVHMIFEDASDEQKQKYYENHLTTEEFYNNLKYFVRINKHDITNNMLENIKYEYAAPGTCHNVFVSKVSFDNGQTYETLKEIYLKCCVCGTIFKVHIDNIRKKGDLSKVKCKSCIFCNYTYEVRRYDNSELTYQSNLEKLFIDKIKSNNYEIENGQKIKYFYNYLNKYRNYYVDFYLPQFKIMVEIKGNNKFYRDDLETGKFDDKCNAAKKYAESHNMKFVVLFENDIDDFIESLTKQQLV